MPSYCRHSPESSLEKVLWASTFVGIILPTTCHFMSATVVNNTCFASRMPPAVGSGLVACLLAFLLACLLACLLVCLPLAPVCSAVCRPPCWLACLLSCLLAWLRLLRLLALLACSLACLLAGFLACLLPLSCALSCLFACFLLHTPRSLSDCRLPTPVQVARPGYYCTCCIWFACIFVLGLGGWGKNKLYFNNLHPRSR